MAEWLRRQIRIPFDHLFPYGSAGSNPAGVVFFEYIFAKAIDARWHTIKISY